VTSFLQTSNGDLELTNGRLTFVRGREEKAQKIRNKLGLAVGEWFLDTREGVPWFGLVLGQKPDLEIIKRLVTETILSTPGMSDVPEMGATFDGVTREAACTWRALDDEGEEIPGGFTPFILRTV
jgi:hypothetical protein